MTHDWDRLHADDFAGAVPLLSLTGIAIGFDELGVIDLPCETVPDGRRVDVPAVRSELEGALTHPTDRSTPD